VVCSTENLKAAIAGGHYEYAKRYPGFADIAENAGFPEIARGLRAIAKAEKHHEERYKKSLKEVEGGTVFKKDRKDCCVCRRCGDIHEGEAPPGKCPSCDLELNYFQVDCEE
jgi:rubrerythrin